MCPSKNVRRAGVVATGTFLLAMAASPAYAIGAPSAPSLVAGAPCTSAEVIPSSLNLQCLNGILQAITAAVPPPPPAPAGGTATTPAPNPLGGVANGVGGAVGSAGTTVSGVAGQVGNTLGGVAGGGNGGGGGLGGLPIGPGSLPSAPGGIAPSPMPTSGATSASGGGTAANTPAKGKTSDGSRLLGPAAAFLPGVGIASFADLGSGGGGTTTSLSPLADNIPSPLLASPEAKLAAVQAPLIAAGERAANDNSLLSRLGGKALPGILVVIGTAMVAAVGAGNIKAWQARLAAKREAATA